MCVVATALITPWTLVATDVSAQTILRYKFKQGDTLKYAITQKMKMTMNVAGKDIDMNMDQTSELVWSIASVDDNGSAKIAVKFGRNKLSMAGPQGKTQVDSGNRHAPDDAIGKNLYQLINAMSGLEVTHTLSSTGEISDVVVSDEALKKLQKTPGSDLFGDMLSGDGLKRMLSQSGLTLPKDAVKKGSSWRRQTDMNLPVGKMVVEIRHAYADTIERDGRTLAKITLTPKATLAPNPSATVAMNLKSQRAAGHALFDVAAGRLVEMDNRQTMEFELEVNGMNFSQRMVQSVNMRLANQE